VASADPAAVPYNPCVARSRSPARLVVALGVAAVLAVFLLYTSFAGGTTPALEPSQLTAGSGKVELTGIVVGPVRGDAHSPGGLRFRLRDRTGGTSVPVAYTGLVPDLFRPGREIYLNGSLKSGVFVGQRDSLVTRCPSKYSPPK
jgi:cytochrome c-type biogenesis protein CcmE